MSELGKIMQLYCQMCSASDFRFRAFKLVMLVLNPGKRWRVDRGRLTSFVCKIMFSAISPTILKSQFISIGTRLLKRISSEDFASKS